MGVAGQTKIIQTSVFIIYMCVPGACKGVSERSKLTPCSS